MRAHIAPHFPVWTFAAPALYVQEGDGLVIRTNCPGRLSVRTSADEAWGEELDLIPARGAVGSLRRFGRTIGPFSGAIRWIEFRFRCMHPRCPGTEPCCRPEPRHVDVLLAADPRGDR